jgi:hypothetical protein
MPRSIAMLEDAKREYVTPLNKWEELPRNVDAMITTVRHPEYLA